MVGKDIYLMHHPNQPDSEILYINNRLLMKLSGLIASKTEDEEDISSVVLVHHKRLTTTNNKTTSDILYFRWWIVYPIEGE